ncbi:MAG: response regulator transcription factor [Mobilitalea sp.]
MSTEIHILLIEDDIKIINFMSMALKAKGYRLTVANTGNSGILAFCTENPDIVLLDLGLPDKDGIEIMHEIRKVSQIPILVVSAREQEKDKILALDAGANDYVTKPFAMGELLARIRVMERFIEHENLTMPDNIFHFDYLTVDFEKRRIFIDETEIHLTPIEYKLLMLLIANRGKVVTHNQISKEVWGYGETGDSKSIRVFMAGLRRKIEKDTSHPQFITTELGVGYRFIEK